MKAARIRRDGQAGLTLIEVLVVLVLIGAAAGTIGLSVGPTDRTIAIDRETRLLEVRFEQAADRAMITGNPAAFIWQDDGYRFLEFDGESWGPHGLPVLGEHQLPGGMSLIGPNAPRQHVIRASLLNGSLALEIADGRERKRLVFDGMALAVAGI